jgi:antitoxin CptB
VKVTHRSATTTANAAPATALPVLGSLRWRCRRGMKELDVLLERFAQQVLPQASQAECRVYAELLALPDPLLAGYLLGGEPPAEPHLAQAVRRIRALCRLGDGSAVF